MSLAKVVVKIYMSAAIFREIDVNRCLQGDGFSYKNVRSTVRKTITTLEEGNIKGRVRVLPLIKCYGCCINYKCTVWKFYSAEKFINQLGKNSIEKVSTSRR